MSLFSYENLIDPILKNIRRMIPEFSGMKAGDIVLDVCCGTGAQVFEYGQRGIPAIGIDQEPNMLKIALKNKKKLNSENTSFNLADATNLPFFDNKFDYVSVSFGLHDKEREIRNKIVSEMKRVVKNQGFLVLVDYRVPLPGNLWAVFIKSIEFIVGGSHYRGFRDYMNSGGLTNLLQQHSLLIEKVDYLKKGTVVILKAKDNSE